MWRTVAAKRSRTGRTASSAVGRAAGHERQRARLGRLGAAGDAGVEELDARGLRARAWIATVDSGEAVLRSTTIWPLRQCARHAVVAEHHRLDRPSESGSESSTTSTRRDELGGATPRARRPTRRARPASRSKADDGLARVEQPAGDPAAHVAGADDADRVMRAPCVAQRRPSASAETQLDADAARQLEDLHDLLPRRARAPSALRMCWRRPGSNMCVADDVEGGVDQLPTFGSSVPVLPRVRRQRRVGREELRVEAQQAVPERVPVAALVGELGLDLLLPRGQRLARSRPAARRPRAPRTGSARRCCTRGCRACSSARAPP